MLCSALLRRISGSAAPRHYKGYELRVENALKDLKYFNELFDCSGWASELGRAVTWIYEEAVANGRGDQPLSELGETDKDDITHSNNEPSQ